MTRVTVVREPARASGWIWTLLIVAAYFWLTGCAPAPEVAPDDFASELMALSVHECWLEKE